MKKILLLSAALLAAAAPSAEAQLGGRLSVEPYVAYGFFGELPDGPELEADVAFGGRAAYQFSDQWALFGNFQQSTPSEVTVRHWSAGVEFSYVPRGGAEGMLPVLLEAGVGQARYDFAGDNADLAVNLGIGSALQLTPNLGIRYGANDYISNFRDQGITNQIFVDVGVEYTF